MPASNLIQFKRGTSARLQQLITAKSGIDGCFYLTVDDANTTGAVKDSSRLYVGRADGSIVPVNQGITTVSSTSELVDGVAHGDLHAGDFAYVSGSNIFAIYDGAKWVQINSVTDTFLDAFNVGVGVNDGVATVTSQATLNQTPSGKQSPTMSSAFKIAGDNGVSVAIDANDTSKLIISGESYNLGSAAVSNNATTINLTHGANNASAGSINVSSANNAHLHITGAANNIVIDAPVIATTTLAAQAQGFAVQSTDTFNNSTTASTIDPTITYGEDSDQTAHFVNGNAVLNVYTKEEVDDLKKALNALTYRGTVGTGGSVASIAQAGDLHNGDVFKVITNMTDPVTAKEGDLIIVRGTENSSGVIPAGDASFDVVPSGDDVDTYYVGTAISHGWKIDKNTGAGSDLGSISFTEGTAIKLTDDTTVTSPNKKIEIAHADVNANAINATGSDNVTKSDGVGTSFTAITGIAVNKQGHVTSVTTKTLTLADENTADINAVTDSVSGTAHTTDGTKSSATVTTAVQMTKNDGSTSTAKSGSFSLSSDNLTITANTTSKDVKVNFVWESF